MRKWMAILLFVPLVVCAKMRIYENVKSSNFPVLLQENLAQQPYWESGFLDVTKAPYNAKGDGVTDDSYAIQMAIDHAFACNLTTFFPEGEYLISRQLRCVQPQGSALPNNAIGEKSQRKFGHILLGDSKQWPTLKLKDQSSVTDSLFIYFAYINEDGEEEPSRHYLGSIRNFKINMGNNPEISAVYNAGAQLNVIQNLEIWGDFDKGIASLPGSGGYTANVKIVGGNVGIYQNEYRPTPTVFGVELIEQKKHAIELLNCRGTMTVSGFKIEGPSAANSTYKAVKVTEAGWWLEQGAVGNLVLSDGSIEQFNDQPAMDNYRSDLVFKNVWLKGATLIASGTYNMWPSKVLGNSSWQYLDEYIYATGRDQASVYRDEQLIERTSDNWTFNTDLIDSLPPSNLLSLHIWDDFPSWQNEVVSVTQFGATADNSADDDALAIQEAINEVAYTESEHYGKTVFIPRGHFHIKSPLVLKDGVKMIGAGKHISVIAVDKSWLPDAKVKAVSSENIDGKGVVLGDIAFTLPSAALNWSKENRKNFTLLNIQSANSIIRDVQTAIELVNYSFNAFANPLVEFSGNAGGKVYGLCLDEGSKGAVEDAYRLLKIAESTHDLYFYQLSVEDVSTSNTPEEETENLLPIELSNCNKVVFYGFKYEGLTQHIQINNTQTFEVYGASGNFSMKNTRAESMIELNNVPNVFLANISHHPVGDLEGKYFIRDGNLSITDDKPIALFKKEGFPLSIKNTSKKEIRIYPNPINDSTQISMNAKSGSKVKFSVYTMKGELVLEGTLPKNGTLDCSKLNSGIYLLNLVLDGQFYGKKLVVS